MTSAFFPTVPVLLIPLNTTMLTTGCCRKCASRKSGTSETVAFMLHPVPFPLTGAVGEKINVTKNMGRAAFDKCVKHARGNRSSFAATKINIIPYGDIGPTNKDLGAIQNQAYPYDEGSYYLTQTGNNVTTSHQQTQWLYIGCEDLVIKTGILGGREKMPSVCVVVSIIKKYVSKVGIDDCGWCDRVEEHDKGSSSFEAQKFIESNIDKDNNNICHHQHRTHTVRFSVQYTTNKSEAITSLSFYQGTSKLWDNPDAVEIAEARVAFVCDPSSYLNMEMKRGRPQAITQVFLVTGTISKSGAERSFSNCTKQFSSPFVAALSKFHLLCWDSE